MKRFTVGAAELLSPKLGLALHVGRSAEPPTRRCSFLNAQIPGQMPSPGEIP